MKNGVPFRKAVFNLCKDCATRKESVTIRNLIHEMSVTKQKDIQDSKTIIKPAHGDFAYIAREQNAQFLGYILVDENAEKINTQPPFHITNLEIDERYIFEMAYKSIDFFISECLLDLTEKYPHSVSILHPYNHFILPKMKTDSSSFLTKDDIGECVTAFKQGKLYKKLMSSEALVMLENVPQQTLQGLSFAIERQLSQDLLSVTDETKNYLLRVSSHTDYTPPEILNAYVFFCYALRNSLCFAIQMLYESIIGCEMVVLNNDNLINIENHENDMVYEKYKVLSQDIYFDIGGSRVGSIALLDCDPSQFKHIKEFGIIHAITMNLAGEFGNSSRLTIITVDEELNSIHRMTELLLSSQIGKIPIIVRTQHQNNK